MIYQSEPFIVEQETEVLISPIELDIKRKEKKDEVTKGVILINGNPADHYVLKIFKITKSGKKSFVGFTFTDSFGQFLIPLSSKKYEYIIRVYSLKEETENLELIMK